MANALPFYQQFINLLYSTGDISVPVDFHDQCSVIETMFDDDITGLVNTLLDYSVNSASEANYHIECSNDTLQKLLNTWLDKINIEVKGVPTGLQALSKEYFKERWEGSSFCILRGKNWEKITVENVSILVPTVLWFVNGSSIYVKRPKSKNVTPGTDKYYLDSENKNEIPMNDKEFFIVQKPFNRWGDEYATPYTIRKGIYKNWLGLKTLQGKSDQAISKVLPYLFLMTKGTERMFLEGEVDYKEEELKEAVNNFKQQAEKYLNQSGKLPMEGVPFDQKYEHLIPDLSKILKEELYRQGTRSVLAGLGFIDMLEIEPSRQESRLNPKPFITEINDGVNGFEGILLEVIYQIINKNKKSHQKLFSENGKILVVNSPLKINTERILDAIRSGFDRGVLSIESYTETLGFDFNSEKERRTQELDNGTEKLMYPHLTQNREDIPDRTINVNTTKETKKEDRKKGSPESKNFKAEVETSINKDDLEIAPYKTNDDLPKHLQYLPEDAKTAFRDAFNNAYPKGEDYAFPIAYTALKRWLKKHGYKKEGNKWVKSEENK